jgi:hypothetical protein
VLVVMVKSPFVFSRLIATLKGAIALPKP